MFTCAIISACLLVVVAIHYHCNSPTMMISSQEVRQKEVGHVQMLDN